MNTLLQDLKFGLRMLRRSPGFTAVVIFTLALGIGANTAIFSIFNALLLRQLPVPASQQLVRFSSGSFSYPDYLDFRNQSGSFESLCADYELPVMANLNSTRPPERVMGTLVTGNFFSTLGLSFTLGRGFSPEEDQVSDPKPGAVLSYSFWRLRFGADREIIGKTVRLNGAPYTIVGVTSPQFHGVFPGLEPDFWAPMALLPKLAAFEQTMAHPLTNRKEHGFDILGRIKAGTSQEQALAEANVIYNRIRKATGKKDKALLSFENPARLPGEVGVFALGVTAVLMAVAGLVLLIACINVMNLLLARASVERKEFATRLALGGSRSRLIRQVMTGNFMLALPGAALGFLLSVYAMAAISRLRLPPPIPLALTFTPDTRVFLLTILLAVVTTLVFGLAPALLATRPDVAAVLRDGGRSSGSRRGRRLRKGLIVAQVAASVVALFAAGLFLHSLKNAYSTNLGFNPKDLLVMRMDPELQGYSNAKSERFFRQLDRQVSELPGVQNSSFVTPLPLAIVTSGRQVTVPATRKTVGNVRVHVVGAHYFETMDIPLLRGSTFRNQTGSSPLVAVISDEMAKDLFPDQDPVGQQIQSGGFSANGVGQKVYEVIGVVGNTKSKTVGEPVSPCLYLLMDQNPYELSGFSSLLGSGVSLVVRTAGSPRAMINPVIHQVHALDPDLPVFGVETMEEQIGSALIVAKVAAALLTIFGCLSLVLAAIGLYGVMSYSISCRTHEIGIRMALGARRADVLRLAIGQGLKLVLAGMILGLVGAIGLARLLPSLLYGIKPTDPLTFVAVSLILTAVALAACYIPARRATRIDPMEALRYE